ncbi:MAG TPA: hypothetical protein VIW64_16265 [Pyrinomonadaceae bacterium]|jgi:hypothetical protein
MPSRHAVASLPPDQLKFVLDHIIAGETDREISFAFEDKFKTKLSKSGLARWRKAAGDELADRYRMARYQARQLIEDLKEDPEIDKHELVIASIEDRLLTATHEVMSQDPFKLLLIQQEEKRRALREQELRLKERAQQFHEEQTRKSESLQQDRLKIAADAWRITLGYLLEKEPQAADLLTKHSDEILNAIEENIEAEAA